MLIPSLSNPEYPGFILHTILAVKTRWYTVLMARLYPVLQLYEDHSFWIHCPALELWFISFLLPAVDRTLYNSKQMQMEGGGPCYCGKPIFDSDQLILCFQIYLTFSTSYERVSNLNHLLIILRARIGDI